MMFHKVLARKSLTDAQGAPAPALLFPPDGSRREPQHLDTRGGASSRLHLKNLRKIYKRRVKSSYAMNLKTKSLEVRQKMPRSASKIDTEFNPDDVPQYFQVSVNILEGRKFSWANPKSAASYVIVVLDKKKHRTSVRRNMEEPYYRESFVFELYASVHDVQRQSLFLAVLEPRCCAPPRLLGEANIDLAAVWVQPHHTVSHKWAQLTLPKDDGVGPVGFLKVDISILFRGEMQVMSAVTYEAKMEDNLLLPSGAEQQRASYQITVYAAYSIPSGTHCHVDRFAKPPSTFVRVSFCGLVAKTGIQCRTNNPMYAEQISMVEMFPNICQMIKLEVCSADGCANRVLASTHLKLAQISHGGENGFLPTFGPSLLHMYGPWSSAAVTTGEDGPYHRGVMLVALKTVVPYYKHSIRTINVEPVAPFKQESQWSLEDFCVYCPIFEVSMLDRRIAGKYCGVAITIGEMPCENRPDEDFVALMTAIKDGKLHYTGTMDVLKSRPVYGYLEFPNEFPVLQLAVRLPDFRFRMFRNNMIHEIVSDLELDLSNAESRLLSHDYSYPNDLIEQLNRSIDDAAAKILKFLDIVQYSSVSEGRQYSTELDMKQMQLQKEEIEKIYQRISKKMKNSSAQSLFPPRKSFSENEGGSKKAVKLLLAEGRTVVQDLQTLIFKTCEGWPDVVLWLLTSGSRVAYAKIQAADIIHSVIPEQRGRDCGEIKTFYLKPLKCPKHINSESSCCCVAAKIELLAWMGPYRQRGTFDSCLPAGHKLKNKDSAMLIKCSPLVVECRVNIYRAKLIGSNDAPNVASPFVRVNFMNTIKETQVLQKTVNPVWNEVIRISRNAYTSPERLTEYPPEVLIEVYDGDSTDKKELLGRLQVEPVVDDRRDFAPQLEWQDLLKGDEPTGRILISAQLMQMPEKLLKTTYYSPTQESFYAPGVKEQGDVGPEVPEPLPTSLIPTPSTYKVDVYWWGLRNVSIIHKPCVVLEMEDVTIKSSIITDAKANCNFPNGKTSQIFEANLGESNCSPLSVRLYDSSTFGRTLFLGLNVVKKPHKYMVGWIPKNEREESLYSSSIMSAAFVQVNRMVFVKRSLRSNTEESEDALSQVSSKKSFQPMKAKVSIWRRILCNKEADEEEYTLLPIFSKEKHHIKVVKPAPMVEERNWWMRYSASLADYIDDDKNISDHIVIYDSELECQPEFSRFKDWCSTLKIYNGKKTGIPEKDEQLHCGYLKVGIAIYKWPPPGSTVAVSPCGVELDRGYFDDYPENEPSKFLVRVYVVKACLLAKDLTEKSFPYVTVQCGRKMLGDRNNHATKTVNPVFGKVYEVRCSLPEDYLLKVSLLNCDTSPPDDLIGTTCIDLEDRVYTKHRASVGLATEYNLTGPMRWRDHQKPSAILEDLCLKNHLPPPMFPDASSVMVNGVEYKDCDNGKRYGSTSERKENICLNLLHKWHTLPICGHRLVPEHVETRSLYHPEKPDVEQGKIQLWVDMFPLESGLFIPAPVDVTPRHVEEFELRVIVWDVKDVKLRDDRADIYVKAWIGPSDEAQDTDIHFESIGGEGSFNWRMIFHFQYQHAERKLVLQEKGPFTEVEEHFPPILIVQVQDSAAASPEEFLGTLMLDLTSMPRGAKVARHCTPAVLERRKINLFVVRTIRAWWPLKTLDRATGNYHSAGMIDLELTLLPKDKALLMPVGVGREAPTPLPDPKRSSKSKAQNKKDPEGIKIKIEEQCQYLIDCFKRNKRAIISFCLSILLVSMIISACCYWDLPSMVLDTLVEPAKWEDSYVLRNQYRPVPPKT